MSRRWDAGVRWYTDLLIPPSVSERAVDLTYIREKHLRTLNANIEDEWIEQAIRTATGQAEHYMSRVLVPQTWAIVLDRFPASEIQIPMPPLLEIVSIVYTDTDGVDQTLSAAAYRVIQQVGPKCRRSSVEPIYGTTWPTARCQRDAVTVTFRAGYVQVGASPETPEIPAEIQTGIGMRVAELYKQRSDSVIGFGVTVSPSIVASRHCWHDFKVY